MAKKLFMSKIAPRLKRLVKKIDVGDRLSLLR